MGPLQTCIAINDHLHTSAKDIVGENAVFHQTSVLRKAIFPLVLKGHCLIMVFSVIQSASVQINEKKQRMLNRAVR